MGCDHRAARVADDPGEPAVATNGRRDQHRPIRDVTAVHDGLQVLLAAIGSMPDDRVAGGGVESPEHTQGVPSRPARQQPLRPGPRSRRRIGDLHDDLVGRHVGPRRPRRRRARRGATRAPRPACHVGGTHDGGAPAVPAKGDIALDAAWTHSDAAQEAHYGLSSSSNTTPSTNTSAPWAAQPITWWCTGRPGSAERGRELIRGPRRPGGPCLLSRPAPDGR